MSSRTVAPGLKMSLLALLFLSSAALAQTTHVVTVGDNFFSPANLTIQVGDTVEWRNAAGGMAHNVTANDGSFASATATSFTFSRTFTTAGSVNYYCTVHPGTMTGVITVQAAAAEAELVLREVSVAPGSYPQGSTISIDAEVENTGNASSGSFTIRHYASTDASITAQDRLLGTENRASLPSGENSHGPFNATIPANLAPGTYFIGSRVDFSDSDSSNNTNVEESPISVTAESSFRINAGLSDAWYFPPTGGQGFFIIVWEGIQQVFLSWFTYDTERPPENVTAILGEPGHRWLTAQGQYAGDTAVLNVTLTEGGVFDAAQPPAANDPNPVGTITIVWTSCNAGLLTYDMPGLGLSGDVPIERIVLDNVPACEAAQ